MAVAIKESHVAGVRLAHDYENWERIEKKFAQVRSAKGCVPELVRLEMSVSWNALSLIAALFVQIGRAHV